MEVDNCLENKPHSCPRDFVKPLSLVMDDHGSQSYPRSSALRLSPKSKAPSPPALKTAESPGFSHWPPGNPHVTMETKENLTDRKLTLTVVLPGGVEEMTVVHGSKAQMDLLVALCAQYHLNPSSHTLELVTANKNIKFKPNALIGTFNAEKVILKSKGEDKNKKTGPQMPEATVRMVINYKRTQKTILRVSPRVPLAELLPAICEKCEFNTDTTVLLRDAQSPTPLDLSSCLNDHAIREVYARDTKGQAASPACSVAPSCADISATCEDISPTCAGAVPPGKNKNQKEEENKGLFSMFRKSKKKSEQPTTASAPASPVLVTKPRPLSMALPCSHSSPLGSDAPKKRRAPQPPIIVSQSQDAELGARRRLNSEPNARLDSDQRTGLSRGSSAESSLRRTKRKAPPPPTSPTPSVQDSAPPDENLQAANTLEEIREQEETTASVISAAGSSIQGDDSSLNMSPDHSLHSLSLDIETGSTMSLEGGEEDQSGDLSSDGNQLQSAVSDSATLIVRQPDGADSSKVAVTDGGPVQAEDAVPHPVCDESPADGAEDDLPAPSPPPPVTQDAEAQDAEAQDAEAQACAPAGADPLQEVAENCSTSHPTGEDAQVQTDFMPLPEPPRQHTDEAPSSAHSLDSGSAGKTNATTLTEELEPSDLKSASSHTSEASLRQDSLPRVPAAEKEPPAFAADAEPKPKPSNELTRDYIPKVGMTTYTIVPQKTLEKLRYFEVALTLETPDDEAPAEGQNVGSLDLHEDKGRREQTEVPKEGAEPHSDSPSEDLLTSTTTSTTITTTTSTENTVNGVIPEPTHSFSPTSLHGTGRPSSLANGASQAGSPTEVKEMKVPPATKPKPTSFRLAQPKKAPGHYVTSAAEKSPVGSPASGFKETQGSAERPALPPPPPPPPPPSVQCQEETAGATNVQPSPTRGDKNASLVQMTRQSSLPSREPSIGLSLEKLRSFAAPRPFTPSSPSRFAQAVSSAVKRSQSLSHGPKSPPSSSPAPVSPVTSHSSVMESKGLCYLKDCEDGDADRDGSTLQREESNVQLTGDNSGAHNDLL